MKFTTKEHEEFYEKYLQYKNSRDYEALIYTLGIDELCRKHFNDLYDLGTHTIKPEGLRQSWQTGASKRITRLAFHLFTWEVPAGENASDYTIKSLFSSLDESHRSGAILSIEYYA